jgi:hypothetical protein
MKKSLFFGALFLATAAAAVEPSASTSNSSAPDPNQTICRMVGDTSSRLGHTRVCMTREQWGQQRRNSRQNNRSQPTRADPPSD